MKKEYRKDFEELDKMAEKWASSVVGRQELKKMTGGLLNGGTEANKESRKDVDALKPFRMGKKIFYTVENVIETIKLRMSKC